MASQDAVEFPDNLERTDFNEYERRPALITRELLRYGIDIAALAETRLADVGFVEEIGSGYAVF